MSDNLVLLDHSCWLQTKNGSSDCFLCEMGFFLVSSTSEKSVGIETDEMIVDKFMNNTLVRVFNKPTRGRTILDLALVDNVSTVIDIDVKHSFGSSDYKTVHLTIY